MHPLHRIPAMLGLFCATALSVVAFEGKLTQTITSKSKTITLDYAIKDELVRINPQVEGGEKAAIILNWTKREMTILIAQQNMYMVMPMKLPPETPPDQAAGANPPQNVAKTGHTATILGYPCEEYVTHDKNGGTVSVWATDKLGGYFGMGGGGPFGGGRGGDSGWDQAIKGKTNFFPLRVTVHDRSGQETMTLETKAIEPGSLPDSEFAPPPGYQAFAMPGGMNPFGH